ncbi:MAG: hypothetical protein AB7U25_14940 [Vicinamibacterales bacterium]
MRMLMGVGMLMATGVAAVAQTPPPARTFAELAARITVGERLEVVDLGDQRIAGRLADVTATTLTLRVGRRPRAFTEAAVARVERRRPDRIRNGVLIGLGVGAVVGTRIGPADSQLCRGSGLECGQGALIGTIAGGFWGALLGWAVDAARQPREIVFAREPVVTPVRPGRR